MEVDQQRLAIIANKRFGDILREGFKLFSNSYGYIILPLMMFSIISIILQVFLLTDLEWRVNELDVSVTQIMENLGESDLTESDWNLLLKYLLMYFALIFLNNLIAGMGVGGIITTIAMCSVSTFLYKKYVQGEADFMSSFKSSFNAKMLLVILIIGIFIPIGTFLFFIPAVIIYGFFIFLIFTYNMKDIDKPTSRARFFAKGAFWKLIGVFVINFLILATINMIYTTIIDSIIEINVDSTTFSDMYNSWYDPATRNFGMIILYQILYSIVDILFAPLFICLLTSLFATTKAKKDLGYDYRREAYPISIGYQEPYTPESYEEVPSYGIPLKEGFYCPFCGHHIKSPKKFCPKCGEDISFINE
ncbi:MAG: zinc ribbon domain-containing protein [Promethearchaeota archaeon]